eukprot:TRINITY_DN1584_c0_g2_i1.p1 TRINITY_DN1584_c0_g2~~TRINITY_DN1584_c0_g2_i1.p1  ORF type:complete len:310 (+),score=61.30 TRINITY_DN1584_c0_g2_i1:652-1581(+)
MAPSVSDGRDLLNEFLNEKEWSPAINLSDIITNAPRVVAKALQNPLCGSFHLGQSYNINLWYLSDKYFLMRGKEIYTSVDKVSPMRVIVLTDNALVILEPNEGSFSDAVLVAWGFLYSLVKLNVTNKNSLAFYWMPKGGGAKRWRQSFQVESAESLAKEVVSRVGKLEVSVKEESTGVFEEEEVTPKAIAKLDINKINENIALCESSLELEPSISKFQTLMLLYQKAVEYYSAVQNPVHELYVKRLQKLIQTAQVQNLLPSAPESSLVLEPDNPKEDTNDSGNKQADNSSTHAANVSENTKKPYEATKV